MAQRVSKLADIAQQRNAVIRDDHALVSGGLQALGQRPSGLTTAIMFTSSVQRRHQPAGRAEFLQGFGSSAGPDDKAKARTSNIFRRSLWPVCCGNGGGVRLHTGGTADGFANRQGEEGASMEQAEKNQSDADVVGRDAPSRSKDASVQFRELCIDAALIGGAFLAVVLSIIVTS